MADMHERWTDRLSEYLDGGLDSSEARELQTHLAGCPDCSRVLEDLRAVIRMAREADDPEPPRDLWPGIREGIGVGEGEPPVIELTRSPDPKERDVGDRGGRRRSVRLTLPQLAAAGLVLALASGAAAWGLRGGADPGASEPSSGSAAAEPGRFVSGDTRASSSGTHAEELRALEEILRTRRHLVDERTVRILEKNLDLIDRAIRESRRALELDPGNAYLEEHLDNTIRRRLEFLRDAAATLESAA